MARSNQNLLQMVNTLLEVYRFEAGRKNLVFSLVDLQDLLEELLRTYSLDSGKKTITTAKCEIS